MRGLLFFVLLLCGLTATMMGGHGADVNVREPEGCDSCAPATVQAQVREGVMTGLSRTMVEQGEIEEQVQQGLSGIEEQVQQGLSGIKEQVQQGLSGVEDQVRDGLSGVGEQVRGGLSGIGEEVRMGLSEAGVKPGPGGVVTGGKAEKKRRGRPTVVADSESGVELPAASVYDRRGKAIGVTDRQGRLPELAKDAFPLTLRYVGFADRVMEYWERGDTVFMSEDVSELPELLVEERSRKLLHILAYIREYSTLSTYTDTVLLFREKMVDYMLRPDDKVKFRDWSTPRILASRSYYRFGNSEGLDSVSDESQHHFSWSDWLGIPSAIPLPHSLWHRATGRDTVRGRVSAAERWERDDDMVRVEVDVLADTLSRKWVPNLRAFLRSGLDFELFKVNLDYMGVTGDSVTPADMAGYSYRIESKGRGRNMFRFNRFDEPFFVTTEATVYILDKEYILPKEAKQWEKRNFDTDAIGICEPPGAPALSAPTRSLIARVDALNKEEVRLDAVPDARIGHKSDSRKNFQIGYRMLSILKQVTGIQGVRARRNLRSNWREFRDNWNETKARRAERYGNPADSVGAPSDGAGAAEERRDAEQPGEGGTGEGVTGASDSGN